MIVQALALNYGNTIPGRSIILSVLQKHENG